MTPHTKTLIDTLIALADSCDTTSEQRHVLHDAAEIISRMARADAQAGKIEADEADEAEIIEEMHKS